MTRKIKFRGLRMDNGKWMYGHYYNIQEKDHYILVKCALGLLHEEVIPSSIGQFTGITDKNGKDIYEGDYIGYFGGQTKRDYWKYSNDGRLVTVNPYGQFTLNVGDVHNPHHLEVLGNIHEEGGSNG